MTLSLLDPPPEDDDLEPTGSTLLPAPAGWSAPPDRAVYHELLGEIVNTIAPHTEADPVAILTQLLVSFGAAVGRGAFFQVEATRHHPNEYILVASAARERRAGDHRPWRCQRLQPGPWRCQRFDRIFLGGSIEPGLVSGGRAPSGIVGAVR